VELDVTQLPDRVKEALLALLDSVEREDEYLRLQQMRQMKKNNLFWHGFQYLFWSDTDNDWRVPTHEQFEEISSREETKYVFDYVVNHFKAHGEAIIAALSADVPDVQFGPRNAQDPDDIRAVEAADNAAELIAKWNRSKLQLINALFYLATEGFVAAYTYHKKDPDFGVVSIPQYDTRMEQTTPDSLQCPQCGMNQELPSSDNSNQIGGFGSPQGPGQSDQPTQDNRDGISAMSGGEQGAVDVDSMQEKPSSPGQPEDSGSPEGPSQSCPQCGGQMQQQPGMQEMVPFMSGERLVPKGHEVIDVYGPLNVRVPSYVMKLSDSGYLIHYIDADPALFKGMFQNVADTIDSDPGQTYERTMRQSSLSMDGYQLNIRLATQKKCWMRPWLFNRLLPTFDDVKDFFTSTFQKGIYFSVIGRTLCETRDECMDEHWTLTKAGPSKGVHADPLLQSEVPLQEIRNNLTNLGIMQVEYSIPVTYADTEVFDFEGQSKQENSPGYIYPVTPRMGQSISDAFHVPQTTTLNKEFSELLGNLAEEEQFVTGSYPSIYGGQAQGGSKTLGEYEKSRGFALQRLALVYYYVDVWWGETIHKSVLSFIEHQLEDEPITSNATGGWQTKWIKKANFKGSFERLDPDPSHDFPVSFAEKRSVLMNLMQLGNPTIEQVLFSPENAGVVQKYVGLRELKIPTEIQRRKQTREILQLIGLEPLETAPGQFQSPVPIEPDIDDDAVHIEVMTNFLVSDTGQDMKTENPQGYAACLAHLIEHKQHMQQNQMMNDQKSIQKLSEAKALQKTLGKNTLTPPKAPLAKGLPGQPPAMVQ
jgi:hypothetical protein